MIQSPMAAAFRYHCHSSRLARRSCCPHASPPQKRRSVLGSPGFESAFKQRKASCPWACLAVGDSQSEWLSFWFPFKSCPKRDARKQRHTHVVLFRSKTICAHPRTFQRVCKTKVPESVLFFMLGNRPWGLNNNCHLFTVALGFEQHLLLVHQLQQSKDKQELET